MSLFKRAYFPGDRDGEPLLLEVRPGLAVKTASALGPGTQQLIDSLRPDPRYTYVLCNAMGHSQYYGANSNKDWYGHNPHIDFDGLLNAWPEIGKNIEADRMKGKGWPYGYPCFYDAAVYAHHKNTDPQGLGFGDVIYAGTNPVMKRVELVLRVFNEEAVRKGHTSILSRIRAGERVDVSMGAKVPFDLCHAPGTLVRTPTGHRPIEELVVGDLVVSHANTVCPVTRVFARDAEEGEVRRIGLTGSPDVVASEAHPLLVVRRQHVRSERGRRHIDLLSREIVPEWTVAGDVQVGDYLLAPVPTGGSFREERAQLLGYYLGDGHILRQRTGKKKDGPYRDMGVGISVGLDEPRHRDAVLRELSELATNEPNVYAAGSGRRAEQILCYDQNLAAWLQEYGGRGSRGKFLNEAVFSWDKTSRVRLLAGWLDADGCVNASSVRGATVNRGLALDMRRLAHSLGLPASITTAPTTSGKPAYWFHIGRGFAEALLPELRQYSAKLSSAALTDKATGSCIYRLGDYYGFPVRSVSVEPGTSLHNISVAEDESYIAEGIASHNCSICTDWDEVRAAWKTFDPALHRHQGIAILAYHKTVRPIRGLAITRADYCFPAGTMITMASGEQRPIEEIAVGDTVLTHKGRAKRVTHLLPHEAVSPAVKVKTWGFHEQVVTANHPYLAYRGMKTGVKGGRATQMSSRDPEWVEAADLSPTDVVLSPVMELGNGDTDPRLGWLLGLYAAEGSPNFSPGCGWPKSVSLTLHQSEVDLAESIGAAALLLDNEASYSVYEYPTRKAITVRISSRRVAEWCIENVGRGSKHKSLSPWVFAQNKEFARGFLAGWADGDGSYGPTNLRIATSSKELARQGQALAASVGVLSGLHRYERTSNFAHQVIWYLTFNGDAAYAIRDQRPQERFDKRSNLFFFHGYLCSSIRAVEHVGDLYTTYNFEVEDDHSYVAGGLAVHNCECMVTRGGKILPDGQKVFVYNDFPRFFDISFVWIGADRTARVMWHLAEGDLPSSCAPPARPSGILDRMLQGLLAGYGAKTAAMEKDVPGGVARAVHADADSMPELDHRVLRVVTNDPKAALSTLAALGIVLTPGEFQQMALGGAGTGDLSKVSFDTEAAAIDGTFAVDASAFSAKLAEAFSPLMGERSAFAPYLGARLLETAKTASRREKPLLKHAVLDQLAAQYNGYRLSVLEQAPTLFPLAEGYLGGDQTSQEEVSKRADLAGLLLGLGPVIHFLSSHLCRRQSTVDHLGPMANFVAESPSFPAMATIGALLRLAIETGKAGGLINATKLIVAARTVRNVTF
jgi:intein/homing endonuclease